MKSLIALILLTIPLTAAAQIEMVRPADYRYSVTVDGDTVATRSADYKALQDGLHYKLKFPDGVVKVHPLGVEIRGGIAAGTDTVYVTREMYESPLLNSVDWSLDWNYVDEYDLTLTASSQADTVDVHYQCHNGDTWEVSVIPQQGELTLRESLNCTEALSIRFRARTAEKIYTHVEHLPAIVFQLTEDEKQMLREIRENHYVADFTDFNPEEWTQTWGELHYGIEDGALVLELPRRNIARLQWERVPEHTNATYRIVEVLHPSHSTGIHAGLRTSAAPQQNAVETYMHSGGLGISLFTDGGWSNPADVPLQAAAGDTVEYRVTVMDDTMIFEHEGKQWEYTSDTIGEQPPGRFAIGSTGAGRYIILELEVWVRD